MAEESAVYCWLPLQPGRKGNGFWRAPTPELVRSGIMRCAKVMLRPPRLMHEEIPIVSTVQSSGPMSPMMGEKAKRRRTVEGKR